LKNPRLVSRLFFLVALLATISMLAACAENTATTAPATSAAPAATSAAPSKTATTTSAPASTAPAAEVKPIVLKLSTHNPPTLNVSVSEKAWADKIKEMSGGRLQFQNYYSESLAKQTEVFKATQTGVCDIGYMVVGSDASQTPLSMMSRRSFMGLPSMKAASKIMWDLYNKYPEIQAEWKNMKALTFNGLPPDQFFFVKKTVRVPDDMKGLKVIARGDYPSVMTAVGASPVGLNVADWYSSVEKGLVEGQVGIHFMAVNNFKLLEFYKFFTIFGDGGADMSTEGHMINQDSWNKLPADLQKILLESCKWYEEIQDKSTSDGYNQGVEAGKTMKGNFINLTADELAKWQAVVAPIDKKYIDDNASRGPSQAIYDEIRVLNKKYADVK
jgi:TRAP-type transport system periplasmic protein